MNRRLEINEYINQKFSTITQDTEIDNFVEELVKELKINTMTVADRVETAKLILKSLSESQRKRMCQKILQEQVLDQRNLLLSWSTITGQGAQIDTGYIAQHLISLITQIPGQGMRGKGDDLVDKSEIKSANFLDSLDKKGATSPRWNFSAITRKIADDFLKYKTIYLVSFDLNEHNRMRFRAWKVTLEKHIILQQRYKEWLKTKAYPKFDDTNKRVSVNFQLFPPKNKTNENFARHGNDKENGFTKLEIPLENYVGSELIFHAEQDEKNKITIINFN